jgi:hypothetical protein
MAQNIDYSEERLPFPVRVEETASGPVEVYQIPKAQKAAVLKKLYPFRPLPSLDDVMEDIHAEKTFRVGDFIVTREGGMNVLASPYYFESGGSVIDWQPIDDDEGADETEN